MMDRIAAGMIAVELSLEEGKEEEPHLGGPCRGGREILKEAPHQVVEAVMLSDYYCEQACVMIVGGLRRYYCCA